MRRTPEPEELTRRVLRALELAPCSLRALARKAGVPHATLVLIRQGKRQPTRAVADALFEALLGWLQDCSTAAGIIRTGRSPYESRRSRKKGDTR